MAVLGSNLLSSNVILIIYLLLASLPFSEKVNALTNEIPAIQQGISFTKHKDKLNDINQYLVSEKLDGMRGYWNGKKLISRQGNEINAPRWFTKDWPNIAIDGELWSGRDTFQSLMSCIKRKPNLKHGSQSCWKKIKFMVFDLPKDSNIFFIRVRNMNVLIDKIGSNYLKVVPQEVLEDPVALDKKLTAVMNESGEGLMLHLASAYYQVGRSKTLLKLKRFNDAEATVIAHTAGKGKYTGMLGALKVKNSDGKIFKVGSGFSDSERKAPPPVGSIITYKYNGFTKAGIPRFARFWRIRSTD
jgi:DNA ligase-1